MLIPPAPSIVNAPAPVDQVAAAALVNVSAPDDEVSELLSNTKLSTSIPASAVALKATVSAPSAATVIASVPSVYDSFVVLTSPGTTIPVAASSIVNVVTSA